MSCPPSFTSSLWARAHAVMRSRTGLVVVVVGSGSVDVGAAVTSVTWEAVDGGADADVVEAEPDTPQLVKVTASTTPARRR